MNMNDEVSITIFVFIKNERTNERTSQNVKIDVENVAAGSSCLLSE